MSFQFVLVVLKDVHGLSVLDLVSSFLQLQLEKRVRDYTDADIDRLDVRLHIRDLLLNILEWACVFYRVAFDLDLLLGLCQLLVDVHEILFEILHVLRQLLVLLLDLLDFVGVSSVVAGHALKAPSQHLLLLPDLIKSL